MQFQRTFNGVSRDQTKIHTHSGPTNGLSADEKLLVMEALDHLHVTRQYQGMGCCSVCKKISLKKCSGCSTFYCSNECQTFDWPKHRIICTKQRDNLSERGSSVSSKRMLCSSSVTSFNEEPFVISNRDSPFTTLTKQLSKKSGSAINESKRLANFKIANKQYQSRELKGSGLEMSNTTKGDNKNNSRKSFSPKKSGSSKKSSPESQKQKRNNKCIRQDADDKTLRAIENIPNRRTGSVKGMLKNGKLEVVATYRESSDRYWVVSVDNLVKFDEIQAVLSKECQNYESVQPKVGLVCGCTFGDEWFRGEVVALTPNVIVHFIDYGNVSNCDTKVFKKLPDNLLSVPGLAFQIEFEEGTPRQYNTEDLESLKFTIEETSQTDNGVSRVKVIEGIYGATETPLQLAKPPGRKKSEPNNSRRVRSVMESISDNSNGMLFFIPGEGKIRFGSIVPDNNKEANDSIEKVLTIDSSNSSPFKAKHGDYVLVADTEGNDQRGRVVFRLGSTYYVRLIDCGNVILAENVYPLADDLKELIELGVKITVEEVISQELMKRLETCFFAVKGEAITGKWPCTLKGPEQQIIAQVLLEKPDSTTDWKPKFTFLKSGSTVEIATFCSPNALFVRPVDVETEQKFLNMNMEMLQFVSKAPDLEFPPFPGDLCCAKFYDDSCFYRAVVNSVHGSKVWVLFVDFGNVQETDSKDLKPLPETLRNVPIFAVRVELKNVSPKPWNNMIKEYIGKLISDAVELTLTYSDSKNGAVILREKVSGVVVNDFMEKARDKSSTNPLCSGPSLAENKEIYLDDDMEYTKLRCNSTCTLAILYVCESEFRMSQTFWATASDLENFNYVNVELSSLISEYCESISTPYVPAYRELCLAEFEGSWYRAICVGNSGDVHKVFFVDFGNCCVVKPSSIRKIQKKFLKAPALAMNCTVSCRDRIKGNVELMSEISLSLINRINTLIEGVKVTKFEEDTFVLEIPEIEAMVSR